MCLVIFGGAVTGFAQVVSRCIDGTRVYARLRLTTVPRYCLLCWPLLLLVLTGVDSRGKRPLLRLDSPGSVWPPPARISGSPLDGDETELEAPLLTPSAPSLHCATESDACFLDDVTTEVSTTP